MNHDLAFAQTDLTNMYLEFNFDIENCEQKSSKEKACGWRHGAAISLSENDKISCHEPWSF